MKGHAAMYRSVERGNSAAEIFNWRPQSTAQRRPHLAPTARHQLQPRPSPPRPLAAHLRAVHALQVEPGHVEVQLLVLLAEVDGLERAARHPAGLLDLRGLVAAAAGAGGYGAGGRHTGHGAEIVQR